MIEFKNILIYLIFTFIGFHASLKASINEYIFFNNKPTYSNYGSLGLIQNPNARFLEEGTLAFSWSHNEPYLRGSVLAYPFKWLEVSFQYTDINNYLYSEVSSFSGSQSLKDKSFDTKIMLLRERQYLPQVALGFRDFGGSELFASEYIVASKKILNEVDFSFGIGWGKLNGNSIKNPLSYASNSFNFRNDDSLGGGTITAGNFFRGDAGYFAGIEAPIPYTRGLKLKFEYDGTNYQTEALVPLKQNSKFNIGAVYPLNKFVDLKVGYARGNTFNLGFSINLSLGSKNPLGYKKIKTLPIQRPDIVKSITAKSDENLYKAALLYLSKEGISLQNASITNENNLEVVVSQSKFRSPALAAGRAYNVLNQIAPDKITNITVTDINAGMGMYKVELNRDTYDRYYDKGGSKSIRDYITLESIDYSKKRYSFNPEITYPASFVSMGPELISQIGGPDGFFFGDLKWNIDSETLFSRNISLIFKTAYGIYDNMGPLKLASDSILPHVRTDIVKYLKESRGLSITRLQLNKYGQLAPSLFYKLSGGIFESMFNGYGGELLFRPYDKNYGIGLDLWQVYQREYDQMFDVRDYQTVTGHLSFYHHSPSTNILFSIKGGRYLAKDSGFTFDASRIFRSGLRVGAYFTLTDISKQEFGEGSFDKGFYFWIPVEIFSARHFKRTFGWGLRPITRDGGQSLVYGYPLWGVTDASSRHRFMRRLDEFYD